MRDRIEDAIAVGERNQRTMELVHNWCGHVKAKRHGGIGMVEQMTGLPIGHFFLECPHAPAGGMAAFELSETAVDFHDRNCVDCKHRKPMGFPTLSVLVAERDQRVAAQRVKQEHAEQVKADRLAAREAARQAIRASLDPVAATTLDRITELDRQEEGADKRLVETAKLAPETFTPEITNHLFDLINSNEYRLVGPCLETVSNLPVDGARLCNAALEAMHAPGHAELGGAIIRKHAAAADPSLIGGALPSIVSLANPPSFDFGPSRRRDPVPGPLQALYDQHKDAVRAGLREMLEQKDAYIARLSALGLEALIPRDPSLVSFLVPELIARVARANHLLEGREDDVDKALGDIRDTLVLCFLADPAKVDQLIQDYLVGASDEGTAELYKIYDEVLRGVRFSRERETAPVFTPAHDVAFRRLVVAASEARTHEVERATSGFFHGEPYDLAPLAVKHIDLLLGTALVVDTKRETLKEQPLDKKKPEAGLERYNQLQHLSNLADGFVRWACLSAAKADLASITNVLEFLRALPEGRDHVVGSIIGHFHAMMRTPEGLIACLPDFYSAQVGSSQLVRSYAATAFGELSSTARKNLPSLAFEAFCTQLSDPFLVVHKAAARALERFTLPDEFKVRAQIALSGIIVGYAKDRPRDEALVRAVELYARKFASAEEMAGGVGRFFVGILTKAEPYVAAKEVKYGRSAFEDAPGYTGLLLKLIEDGQAFSIYGEDLVERLSDLSPAMVREEQAALLALGKKHMADGPHLVGVLIERFTAAGLWAEALELAKAAHDQIEDNVRNTQIRLHASLRVIACDFEDAVSRNDTAGASRLAKEFDAAQAAIEEDYETHRVRRNPLRGFSGAG
jgi:hypothetical protein